MEVIGFDPALPKDAAAELGIQLMDLTDVWAKSDFITLHTPLTPDTKDLVNDDSIAQVWAAGSSECCLARAAITVVLTFRISAHHSFLCADVVLFPEPDEAWSDYRQLCPRRDHQRGCPSQGPRFWQGTPIYVPTASTLAHTLYHNIDVCRTTRGIAIIFRSEL